MSKKIGLSSSNSNSSSSSSSSNLEKNGINTAWQNIWNVLREDEQEGIFRSSINNLKTIIEALQSNQNLFRINDSPNEKQSIILRLLWLFKNKIITRSENGKWKLNRLTDIDYINLEISRSDMQSIINNNNNQNLNWIGSTINPRAMAFLEKLRKYKISKEKHKSASIGPLPIEFKTITTLCPGEDITDEAITRYLNLFVKSFGYNALIIDAVLNGRPFQDEKGNEFKNNIDDARKHLKGIQQRYPNATRYYFPWNENRHWYLLVANKDTQQISIYDSLARDITMYTRAVSTLKTLLQITNWTSPMQPNTAPQQPNGYDCGVYTILAAMHLITEQNLPNRYSKKFIDHFRARISVSLIYGLLL